MDRILFIFPMTNGRDLIYKMEILKKLKNFSFQFKVFEDFMSDHQIACLRKATDIMIQVQITDQFSGSMQEHLFESNLVITGKWLPYDTLIAHGIYFRRVDTVNDIGSELLSCLQELQAEKQKCSKNPEIIYSLSSWEREYSVLDSLI